MSDRERERKELARRRWGKKSPAQAVKICNSYVPLPTYETRQFNEDVSLIVASLHDLDGQMARLEKLMSAGETDDSSNCGARACTDPRTFRSRAKTILASKKCLQAGMWRANARRRFRSRVSVRAILAGSYEFKVLRNLDEKVTTHTVPKSDGTGKRTIFDFGPVARGAQDLTASILRMSYSPRPFQFDELGVGAKVQMAMDLITDGYLWFAEVDIIKFYQSFERRALEETLRVLPKEAVAHIVVAASAKLVTPKGSSVASLYPEARPGIPSGSSVSVEVAKWSVASMPAFDLGDVVLINHVDNFFLFGRDSTSLTAATKTLRSAIRGCPGGHFLGKLKQEGRTSAGFHMLGCDLSVDDGGIVADPTEANLKKLWWKWRYLRKRVADAFALAAPNEEKLERFLAVVEYVQMEAFADAWGKAFSICSGGHSWKVVTDDLRFTLDAVKKAYAVQADEIRQAQRFMSAIDLDGYWF